MTKILKFRARNVQITKKKPRKILLKISDPLKESESVLKNLLTTFNKKLMARKATHL